MREIEGEICGGTTWWVKVIIRINEVNLLLVCQCQYLELVEEKESRRKPGAGVTVTAAGRTTHTGKVSDIKDKKKKTMERSLRAVSVWHWKKQEGCLIPKYFI